MFPRPESPATSAWRYPHARGRFPSQIRSYRARSCHTNCSAKASKSNWMNSVKKTKNRGIKWTLYSFVKISSVNTTKCTCTCTEQITDIKYTISETVICNLSTRMSGLMSRRPLDLLCLTHTHHRLSGKNTWAMGTLTIVKPRIRYRYNPLNHV